MNTSLPDLASNLTTLAGAMEADAGPVVQSMAEAARTNAHFHLGTIAFKQDPSAADIAMKVWLRQATLPLTGIADGQTPADTTACLREIVIGIGGNTPHSGASDGGGKMEAVRSAGVATAGATVTVTPLLMNVNEVGAVCGGISERQIRSWVSSGRFPSPVELDAKITRWRRSDVETWVKGMSQRK